MEKHYFLIKQKVDTYLLETNGFLLDVVEHDKFNMYFDGEGDINHNNIFLFTVLRETLTIKDLMPTLGRLISKFYFKHTHNCNIPEAYKNLFEKKVYSEYETALLTGYIFEADNEYFSLSIEELFLSQDYVFLGKKLLHEFDDIRDYLETFSVTEITEAQFECFSGFLGNEYGLVV